MRVTSRDTKWFNGAGLWNGLTLGPLSTVSAMLVLMLLDVPQIPAVLLTVLVAPTVTFLLLALIAVMRGGHVAWWVFSAFGAVLGTTVVAGAVLGAISGIAWLLSDPG